jgi:Galactose oxidase, central domain
MRRILPSLSLLGLFLAACGGQGTISIAAYVPASPDAASPNDNVFSQGNIVRVQVLKDGKVKREETFTTGSQTGEIGILAFKGSAQVKLSVENEAGTVIGRGATAILDLEQDDNTTELGILVGAVNTFAPTTKRTDTTLTEMASSRVGLTATEIAGGRVILAGGTQLNTATGAVLADEIREDVEVYDPSTGTYTPLTAKLSAPRAFHTATRLNDGRVVFVGGLTLSSGAISTLITADVLDPKTCGKPFDATLCTIQPLGGGANLLSPRAGHTATLLKDGSILFAGGFSQINSPVKAFIDSVEILVMTAANSGTFSAQGQLSEKRGFAASVLTPDGKVLITGGRDENTVFNSTDIFLPGVGVTPGPEMFRQRFSHTVTAVGPNADAYLMIGGFENSAGSLATSVIDAFDANLVTLSSAVVPFAILPVLLADHTAIRLSNGKVLICGGSQSNGNTINNSFVLEFKAIPVPILIPSNVDALEFQRSKATGLAHSSGQAMIFGGADTADAGTSTLKTGEIFFTAGQ